MRAYLIRGGNNDWDCEDQSRDIIRNTASMYATYQGDKEIAIIISNNKEDYQGMNFQKAKMLAETASNILPYNTVFSVLKAPPSGIIELPSDSARKKEIANILLRAYLDTKYCEIGYFNDDISFSDIKNPNMLIGYLNKLKAIGLNVRLESLPANPYFAKFSWLASLELDDSIENIINTLDKAVTPDQKKQFSNGF